MCGSSSVKTCSFHTGHSKSTWHRWLWPTQLTRNWRDPRDATITMARRVTKTTRTIQAIWGEISLFLRVSRIQTLPLIYYVSLSDLLQWLVTVFTCRTLRSIRIRSTFSYNSLLGLDLCNCYALWSSSSRKLLQQFQLVEELFRETQTWSAKLTPSINVDCAVCVCVDNRDPYK